ncbi:MULTISPECIES: serpin family protein [Streptomyces]|uniref:Serine protease inhibitor n=1 Tax=Streptomyces chartreusis NRRL 3882 TaxID=1079985 RepID=A0A2N9B7K6_STRCX|nr:MULTISPECIES: serpin family protein [Streptomyces]MYS91750.1 proteinase inhibitor I4 serpin [Streptomyces sp. SID5464]SOR79333.1 Serine protease inhibitor [Streptomyces chartreusis NRRL 3882]
MQTIETSVRAANRLTARWASGIRESTVFSAAGVWPLLALLAAGATGRAREELTEALGLPADRAGAAGRELLAVLAEVDGLESALGLWTERTVELREEWAARLPVGAHGVLTGEPEADGRALDTWAARRTGGLIERLPAALRPDTSLVLASALELRADWEVPFKGDFGGWLGRYGSAGLVREVPDIDSVSVARTGPGAVTRVVVRGDRAVDVHLLLGTEQMGPGEVLAAGTDLLAGTLDAVPGSRLPEGAAGPGLSVHKRRTHLPEPPSLTLFTVEFTLRSEHDLLASSALFGLTTATGDTPGPLPFQGVSPAPLVLCSARQVMTATFSAEGFKAAAVTTMSAIYQGRSPEEPPHEAVRVMAVIDRPFGLLAVHRETSLVLAAGWVTDPRPFPEDEDVCVPGTSGD